MSYAGEKVFLDYSDLTLGSYSRAWTKGSDVVTTQATSVAVMARNGFLVGWLFPRELRDYSRKVAHGAGPPSTQTNKNLYARGKDVYLPPTTVTARSVGCARSEGEYWNG
jgi:hypothetical protein